MLQQLLKQQLPQIIEQFKNHKIKRAFAFGSVCTNKFNASSDIDFLISFSDGLDPLERGELWWSLLFALEDAFQRKIDLLTENQLKNPYFIESVNKSKQLIYEA